MKQLHHNTNHQCLKSFSFTKTSILASFKKDLTFEYQTELNENIKMNTTLIIIIGVLSLLTDYICLFCSYFESNSSQLITEPSHMVLRFILITCTMIIMGLWLIFIKKSYHISSIFTEITYILLSQAILSHDAIGECIHIENNPDKVSGYEYVFVGLSACARICIANIFIRYALLKIFSCFCMVTTLVIIVIMKETHHMSYIYSKGLLFVFYLTFLIYFIERIKSKIFEEKYTCILEQDEDNKAFKDIIAYLPENILVIGKNGKIKYANMHFLSCFKIKNENEFSLDKFYNIKQIKQKSDNEKIPRTNNAKIAEKRIDEISMEFDFSNENLYCPKHVEDEKIYRTLNEIIKELLLYDPKHDTELENFLIFHGTYSDSSPLEVATLYEIKIKPRMIKGESTLIIIFKEFTEHDSIYLLAENKDYKNDLLASFSHELRTPLNSQINYLEAGISDPTLDTQVKSSYLMPALQSSKLLKHMINDILDLSSINNNSIALEVNSLSLEATLVQCMELIEFQALRKNIKLELEIDTKLPNIIHTDHNKLAQIIISLLSNSIKFTQQNGKIQVIVGFNDPNIIIITIIDNGIGMTQDEQIRLKERLDNQLKHKKINKKGDGIGIGLTISHVLARLLGPKDSIGLTFESKKDFGTKFSFAILNRSRKQMHLKLPQNILSQAEIKLKSSSQNEFSNTNAAHHNIPTFPLIQQTSSKFSWQNMHVFSCPKMIVTKNRENKLNFIKSLVDQEIESLNTNPKIDLANHNDISIVDPTSQGILKNLSNSQKHNEINKKSIIHISDFNINNKNKTVNHENSFNDNNIIYDKNKLASEFKKSQTNEKYNSINNFHSENNTNIKAENCISEKKCTCAEILIVDDDSFNIMSMECLLKQLKYTYSSAFNGQLAIDQVIRRELNKCSPSCEQYKLILMDFSMPIMNGIEATKILKKNMKDGLIKPIRIIACTAFASMDKRKECIDAGMDDFMSKPIDIAKLKDILSYHKLNSKK